MTDETRFERWLRDGERTEGDAIPAATVVLVRERGGTIETLMLRKNSKIAFGGMWVFPGGRIDDGDRVGAPDVATAARRAAVREAAEEAGLAVDEDSLAWISHWLPPGIAPKRYATWFFVAPAPGGDVTIDGGEIHESDWMQPRDALTRRDALEIELAPPTWMTLHYLGAFDDLDSLMRDAEQREPFFYETHIARGAGGVVALWAGDVGYGVEALDDAALEAKGPRHRLWMADPWRLERDVP